ATALTYQAGCILPAEVAPETLKRMQEVGEKALRVPANVRKRAAQVAVILDFSANLYTSNTSLITATCNGQLDQLALAWIPFDLYMLADLFHSGFPDHKVTLFLNTFYLSEAERRKVDARVKRSGQTAVWLWAGGIIGEEGIRAEMGQRCCGQKMRLEN